MADLEIFGGKPLSGEINPSGNKNAVLPIVCASLLTDQKVKLTNVPNITDLEKLVEYFQQIGSKIEWDQNNKTMVLDHSKVDPQGSEVPFPSGMRSSILLMPPLLKRIGKIYLPIHSKGCALGIREIDPHLEILKDFGVQIQEGDPLILSQDKQLNAIETWQDYMSVTATENFVMAACLAKGTSVMINAASEPHVQDLCHFLSKMGAKISGLGSSIVSVEGVDGLGGCEYEVQSDHHEITTFLALGAMTGGEITVQNVNEKHFGLIGRSFEKLGVEVEFKNGSAKVNKNQTLEVQKPFTSNILTKIEAAPWPYFPVDLLPLMVALATRAQGNSHFWNKVYEGGFYWIPELTKFGAHVVTSDPHRIIVFGGKSLHPATVEAPYIIRAAVALYMVAASIEGKSRIHNAHSIKRAHPNFVENLNQLGAEVAWIND
jgi:UDP-N-acetylglucosamine 1-carboxyvinyltransferase